MPAVSQKQANLMRAAAHGAGFKKARDLRQSMTTEQLRDFATTKSAGLPRHVPKANRYGDLAKTR